MKKSSTIILFIAIAVVFSLVIFYTIDKNNSAISNDLQKAAATDSINRLREDSINNLREVFNERQKEILYSLARKITILSYDYGNSGLINMNLEPIKSKDKIEFCFQISNETNKDIGALNFSLTVENRGNTIGQWNFEWAINIASGQKTKACQVLEKNNSWLPMVPQLFIIERKYLDFKIWVGSVLFTDGELVPTNYDDYVHSNSLASESARIKNSDKQNVTSTNNTNSANALLKGTKSEVIKFKKMDGGTLEIPVIINGVLKINFIFDSGASDVSISPDVALTLIRTGTVKESDFIGSQRYTFADGSSALSQIFIIREIQLGKHKIYNIRASISNSINAPMLLGQSVLEEFGKITIDNKNQQLIIEK